MIGVHEPIQKARRWKPLVLPIPLQQPRVLQVVPRCIRAKSCIRVCWRRRGRHRGKAGVLGEVELGSAASEAEGGLVVGPGSSLSCVEGAEPHTSCFVGVADLGRPPAPRALPDSPVSPPWCSLPRSCRVGGRGKFFHGWSLDTGQGALLAMFCCCRIRKEQNKKNGS